MGTLEGKVAIVTGAGRGIGRAISIEYALEGAKVAVVSRTESRVNEVVHEIADSGGTALGVVCDIGFEQQIELMVEHVTAEYGTVDILVNNAQGFGTYGEPKVVFDNRPIESFPEDEWDWIFETGVKATLRVMKAVFPHMKDHGGRIINFGSRRGIVCDEYSAAYNANKEATRALSKTAAREWSRYGINVNVINPALVTDAARSAIGARPSRTEAVGGVRIGSLGEAREAGRVAVFLAGPDSEFITGSTIFVEGGLTMLP